MSTISVLDSIHQWMGEGDIDEGIGEIEKEENLIKGKPRWKLLRSKIADFITI